MKGLPRPSLARRLADGVLSVLMAPACVACRQPLESPLAGRLPFLLAIDHDHHAANL